MKGSLHREEQRFANYELILILAVFFVLAARRLVLAFGGQGLSAFEGVLVALTMVGIPLTLWYLMRLRMFVSLTKKNVKLKYAPLKMTRRKIKWKNVDEISLIRLPRFFNWTGSNVHFSTDYHCYDLAGKGYLKLVTDDGEVICIGIRKMGKMRNALDKICARKGDLAYTEMDLTGRDT